MNRVLGISLAASATLHLAAGGLAGFTTQTDSPTPHSLSLVVHPLSHQAQPAIPAVNPPGQAPEQASPPPDTRLSNTLPAPLPVPAAGHPDRPRVPPEPAPGKPSEPETLAAAAVPQVITRQTSPQPAPTMPTANQQRVREGLQQLLRTQFYYPRTAQRRGLEGTVLIALHISPDGAISDIRLDRGSGAALLDRAALTSAGNISLTPEAIDWLDGQSIDLILPVTFSLVDG